MSGKVENGGSLESASNRAEGGFFTFEQTRIMKAAGDRVRFRGHIGKRNESIRRR